MTIKDGHNVTWTKACTVAGFSYYKLSLVQDKNKKKVVFPGDHIAAWALNPDGVVELTSTEVRSNPRVLNNSSVREVTDANNETWYSLSDYSKCLGYTTARMLIAILKELAPDSYKKIALPGNSCLSWVVNKHGIAAIAKKRARFFLSPFEIKLDRPVTTVTDSEGTVWYKLYELKEAFGFNTVTNLYRMLKFYVSEENCRKMVFPGASQALWGITMTGIFELAKHKLVLPTNQGDQNE